MTNIMPSLIFSFVFLALLELIVFFPESYFWLAVLGVLALSSYVGNPRTRRAEQSSYDGNPRTRRAEQSRRTQWHNEASHDGAESENFVITNGASEALDL